MIKFSNIFQPYCVAIFVALLSACGSDGTASSNEISHSPPVQISGTKTEVNLDIIGADITSDVVTINFQLVDIDGAAITHLVASDFSVTLAKLNPSYVGNNTGNWQSYINKIEMPGVGTGTLPRMQAILESGSSGAFVSNGNGTYQYTYAQSVSNQPQEIIEQAKIENLDLSYKAQVLHRSGMQLSLDGFKRNVTFDWIPATGKTQIDGIADHAIASTKNCNSCHGELAKHGGARTEIKYCVTCHNPGSTDANSGNTVNFKNMIHKIHRGKYLPSVQAGGEYKIYGYKDNEYNFSKIGFPNDILTCQNCHAGNATAMPEQTPTVNGDNWRDIATQSACGSCHDDLDFSQHKGGQVDDENCMSCHQNSAVAGSISDRHRNLATEASEKFQAEILAVSNTAVGQFPVVQFKVTNPETGEIYDILNDKEWTHSNGDSRLSIGLAWSTKDYTNTGNQSNNSSAVEMDALELAIDNGDGSFTVTSSMAIPDGSLTPNYVATGSGSTFISGHPAVALDSEKPDELTQIGLNNTISYFSIDETNDQTTVRRVNVSTEQCLTCHGDLVKHGNSKANNIQTCVTCHNPRNTDKRTREMAQTPPTDGKVEESLDFKTMIHAIHGSKMRTAPLQLVGYMGYRTHVYDEDKVHYPNQLNNCTTCHVNNSYQLPLRNNVMGSTVSTGEDIKNHDDDIVISPTAAICSSCHDNSEAKIHIESNGGSFSTTKLQIDSGVVIEQCSVCHGIDRVYAVDTVHNIKKVR